VTLNDGTPGNPNLLFVSEAGFYDVLLRSRKPEAKPFRHWVTKDVLPSIRKNGRNLVRLVDNVIVCHDESVVADYDARSERILNPFTFPSAELKLIAEETPEERIVKQRRCASGLNNPAGVDIDDCRRGRFYQRRKGEPRFIPRSRDDFRLCRRTGHHRSREDSNACERRSDRFQ
ncbi:MAG: hypothetical protein EBU57_09020, partial [Alphaproteobacteria bacterium]|nr:hypothetical protein [Alphaproteobacteria bacterium]